MGMSWYVRCAGVAAVWVLSQASIGLAQPDSASASSPPANIKEDLKHARSLSNAFNYAASKIQPSVVHIDRFSRVAIPRFFAPPEEQVRQTGSGTGVIISKDGYIVTNNHVIENAEDVRVRLADGEEVRGKVVGTDPATDLGVVKIERTGLTPAQFGDSDSLQVGDWVLAVGSPFGQFDNSVTAGIVSAKGRTGLAGRDERYEEFIQTDAAINPGNSGGPLVNLEGRVVGINSQIASRSGGFQGLGFSIPTTIARPVMDMIIENGVVRRGWLGVNMKSTQHSDGPGVLIGDVVSGGPAARAGLKNGDIITRFNGRPIESDNRLRNAIAFTAPATMVMVDVLRNGEQVGVEVEVGDAMEERSRLPGGRALARFGFTVENLSRQYAERAGLDPRAAGSAVVVAYVDQLGPAAEAKLQIGDIVVQVQRQEVTDIQEFDAVIRNLRRDQVRLDILRPGVGSGYITVDARGQEKEKGE